LGGRLELSKANAYWQNCQRFVPVRCQKGTAFTAGGYLSKH
jgi:hypothetical protein